MPAERRRQPRGQAPEGPSEGWQEIKAIVDRLQGRWRPAILTAIFTGLRSSELRGLRWADIDFKSNELHVRQRVDQYRKFGAPKSESGERTIPLPPLVANTLKEWKLACPNGEPGWCFRRAKGARKIMQT